MKKLFAILAVLVLFGTYAWAAPVGELSWDGHATNNFQAYVVCQPTLTGVNDIDLGDFFDEETWEGEESLTFTLTGGATEGTDQVFKITYIEEPDDDFIVIDGSWDAEPATVNITGSCGSEKTFTYTLKKAKFTATGHLKLKVGISAELTAY
jgi:hypothetical protein